MSHLEDLMPELPEALFQNEWLYTFPRGQIEQFLHDGSFRIARYGQQAIIHLVGEQCQKLELICSGTVGVERIDEKGHLMSIAEFFAGDLLGGNLMFSKHPFFPMTVSAKEPVMILEIEKETLFQLLQENTSFLRRYLAEVADHTLVLGEKIRCHVNRSIRDGLVAYFLHESKRQNSRTIHLAVSKKALAEKLGVERTSLSRAMAKMRGDKLITFDARSVTLLSQFFD